MDGLALVVHAVNASLNILFCFTATLGNAVILVALPKVTSLHAPSKALLSSLALSDLAVGLFVHPSAAAVLIASITNSTRVLEITSLFFAPLANYVYAVSLLTVAAISVDRFLAVYCQLRYRSTVNIRRVRCVIAAAWFFPATFVAAVVVSKTGSTRTYDIIDGVYFTVCVFAPGVLYAFIYKKLKELHQANKRRYELGPQAARPNAFNIASYQRSVITMFIVYGAILFCYIPRIILVIMNLTGTSSPMWFAHFSATLVFFNSSLNPVIYCWRVHELRQIVKGLLCCTGQ